MSQIFLDNKLFLCGCKLNSINKEKDTLDTNPNSFSSSFMYSIDITKEPITVLFEGYTKRERPHCFLKFFFPYHFDFDFFEISGSGE